MKKYILNTLLLFLFYLFTIQTNAQDGYTYTLIDNGSYSYTIAARPNTSTSNFETLVQSYGFTIILSDGITATITSSLGNAANATFFNGMDVAQPDIDGYLITETLGSLIALPAPTSAIDSPIVTIQVNDTPTTGSIYILANDSPLANAGNSFKSFHASRHD